MAYSVEDAKNLIDAARSGIELYIKSPMFHESIVKGSITRYDSNDDVVIRIFNYQTKVIRSVSVPNSKTKPLHGAVVDAALSAAFGHHNLIPISESELNDIIIELNIVENVQRLSPSYVNRRNEIEIGKHGLIVMYGTSRSVLLPSYAAEQNIDKTHFLQTACTIAGLPKEYWMQTKLNIYKFEAQTFIEQSPGGNVIETK